VAIDRDRALAIRIEPITVTVERGRLVAFARVTGQTDPVYADLDAAKAAGHPDLPVPPTFLFGLELAAEDPFGYLQGLGLDLHHGLHGEQAFRYHAIAHAGDTLVLRQRIVDAYSKKGGALDFVVKQTDISRGGEPVAEAVSTIVVQNR
jgi:acyl dehydratase